MHIKKNVVFYATKCFFFWVFHAQGTYLFNVFRPDGDPHQFYMPWIKCTLVNMRFYVLLLLLYGMRNSFSAMGWWIGQDSVRIFCAHRKVHKTKKRSLCIRIHKYGAAKLCWKAAKTQYNLLWKATRTYSM